MTCFFTKLCFPDDPELKSSQIIAHWNRLGQIWRKIVSTRESVRFRFYRRKIVKNRKYTKNSGQTPQSTRNGRLSDEHIRNYTLQMPTSGFIVGKPIRPEVPKIHKRVKISGYTVYRILPSILIRKSIISRRIRGLQTIFGVLPVFNDFPVIKAEVDIFASRDYFPPDLPRRFQLAIISEI